jgi:hypothetical protein
MGGYGYEIIGGLLIVLSSLVGEEMKPKWKVAFYLFFGVGRHCLLRYWHLPKAGCKHPSDNRTPRK